MVFKVFQEVGEVHLLQLGRQEGVLLLQLVSRLQPLICLRTQQRQYRDTLPAHLPLMFDIYMEHTTIVSWQIHTQR